MKYTPFTVQGTMRVDARKPENLTRYVLAETPNRASEAVLLNEVSRLGADAANWIITPIVTPEGWPTDRAVWFTHELWPDRLYLSLDNTWDGPRFELTPQGDGWIGELDLSTAGFSETDEEPLRTMQHAMLGSALDRMAHWYRQLSAAYVAVKDGSYP